METTLALTCDSMNPSIHEAGDDSSGLTWLNLAKRESIAGSIPILLNKSQSVGVYGQSL